MVKRELTAEVMKLYPRFSRGDAEVMVNALFESMTEALTRDERIELRGFGSFVVAGPAVVKAFAGGALAYTTFHLIAAVRRA